MRWCVLLFFRKRKDSDALKTLILIAKDECCQFWLDYSEKLIMATTQCLPRFLLRTCADSWVSASRASLLCAKLPSRSLPGQPPPRAVNWDRNWFCSASDWLRCRKFAPTTVSCWKGLDRRKYLHSLGRAAVSRQPQGHNGPLLPCRLG